MKKLKLKHAEQSLQVLTIIVSDLFPFGCLSYIQTVFPKLENIYGHAPKLIGGKAGYLPYVGTSNSTSINSNSTSNRS